MPSNMISKNKVALLPKATYSLGKALARLTGTYQMHGESASLTMKLSARGNAGG